MLIREKDIGELKKLFEKYILQPAEVIAYGSRVTGGAHEGSDLDLAIRLKSGKSFDFSSYSDLIDAIKDSNIPILVEIRDWYRMPDYFHKSIEKGFEVIWYSEATASELD